MSRIVRRLVAGTVVAAALTALAPPASASCFTFRGPDGRWYIVCLPK